MANMKHKSVDARRARRSRYVNAIQPIKELFGCTAMEAVGHIQRTLLDNKKLTYDLEKATGDLKTANEQIEQLKIALDAATEKVGENT